MKNLSKKWPLAAAAVLTVVLGGMIVPLINWDKVFDKLEPFTRRSKPVVPAKATVLLVSAQESDEFIVKNTVEPRGYALRVVSSVEAAKEILARDRDLVEVVVFNQAVPGFQNLIQASKSHSPRAHLIALHGRPEPAELSALLVAKALN